MHVCMLSSPGSLTFPGKHTGVDCRFLLQAIFLTQGSNTHLLCLLHWQVGALPLPHLGSLKTTELKRKIRLVGIKEILDLIENSQVCGYCCIT